MTALPRPIAGEAGAAPHLTTRSRPHLARAGTTDEHVLLSRGVLRIADTLIGLAFLIGVLVASAHTEMPVGVDAFLGMRVTVRNVLLLLAFAVEWPIALTAAGLYAGASLTSTRRRFAQALVGCSLGTLVTHLLLIASRSGSLAPGDLVVLWLGATFGILVLRQIVRMVTPRPLLGEQRRVIIVGNGRRALQLFQAMRLARDRGHHVTGFVDERSEGPLADAGCAALGPVESLERILLRDVVDEVIIALPAKSQYDAIARAFALCERAGVPCKVMADLVNPSRARVAYGRWERSLPMMAVHDSPEAWRLAVKRAIDVLGAIVLLVVFAPVMAVAALLIKLTSPGPVLFLQERYGFQKHRFLMYKFRTMVTDAEMQLASIEHLNEATGPIFKIRNDPRTTRVGRILRSMSVDELPQLFNVLRGEMSLVGPRPMSLRDVALFDELGLRRRFSVTPGMTGLWQVSGRSSLSFDRWIALDLRYIDEWSLGLDLRLLLLTIPAVLRRTGAA